MLTYNYFLMQFKEVLLFSQIQKFFNIHYYLYCISQFSLTICYNVFFYLIRILSWYKFIASSANEALRVEFSTSSNFTWGSAQTKENGFLGSLPQTLRGSPRKPRKPVFGGVYCELYVWAPRKLRDKPNPSSHGHGCCVSGSGPLAY